MTGDSGNKPKSILDLLRELFSPKKTPPPVTVPTIPPDSTNEPAHMVTSRVLLVVYDPIMDAVSGQKLSEKMGWGNVDSLVNEFITDILGLSGGLARYQIIQRVEINEFPLLQDGFRYDATSYMAVQNHSAASHQPEKVNYQAILTRLNVLPRIASRDLDEVWVFGFPYGGFYESTMGGAGAFWCNANPIPDTLGCKRRFIVMGFSYERGVGEMLESFGHRAESMVSKVFNCQDFVTWAYQPNRSPAIVGTNLNLFQQYLCFDQIAPGHANIGTIHYAPNSTRDYEWNNPHQVMSNCDDWMTFPNFQNIVRMVGPNEWGGALRSHHEWWLRHLPRAAGRKNGIANNWWQYIMDPNLVIP